MEGLSYKITFKRHPILSTGMIITKFDKFIVTKN